MVEWVGERSLVDFPRAGGTRECQVAQEGRLELGLQACLDK